MRRRPTGLAPPIIVDTVEKLQPFLGKMGGITIHTERILLVFYGINDKVVILSFEPEMATPFFNRITKEFNTLSKMYLAGTISGLYIGKATFSSENHAQPQRDIRPRLMELNPRT